MPILYICMVNQRRTIITEALGTKNSGDFKSQVLKHHTSFERFAKKTVPLTDEFQLSYWDKREYAMVCISNSYDIKELEA